jgi:hypothetical protein
MAINCSIYESRQAHVPSRARRRPFRVTFAHVCRCERAGGAARLAARTRLAGELRLLLVKQGRRRSAWVMARVQVATKQRSTQLMSEVSDG